MISQVEQGFELVVGELDAILGELGGAEKLEVRLADAWLGAASEAEFERELDKLGEELPAVVLSDIEMPRMDGFDLVRNMRSDARLAVLPVIMITSRIAQKHRDYAAQLGVNHYLGKPYSEEELLSLVGRYVKEAATH